MILKDLKKSFGSQAENNIILVLTKIDKEDRTKINLIETEIKKQCEIEVGFSPRVFQISNKRFQIGTTKHKDTLINQSHIHSLIKHIDTIASNTKNIRIERCLNELEASLNDIRNREQALLSRKKQITDDLGRVFSLLNAQTNSLRYFLTDSMKKYREI